MSDSANYYWTEQYHEALKEMDVNDAIKDVNNMHDNDVLYRVNMRKHQQDYIADYLEYLWELSPEAFWRHVEIMFSDETELLISDNMQFISILCNEVAPAAVIKNIVSYTIDKWLGDKFEKTIESLEKDILSEIIQEQDKFLTSGIQLSDIYCDDQVRMAQLDLVFNEILHREIHNSYKNW
ncbi:hypothetical protein [Citrobacter braakii]|uniref:hypothetical protein n=1 Tax=Citrobacter braakii TaxID=57706 RepID=UPI0011590EEE|nr:hypothetical protein [Citrobacter braakii]